jgi:spore germination protein YaaH
MQAQDLAHRGMNASLPAAPTSNGVFVGAQPRQARAQAAATSPRALNNSGLTREVFGFAPYWALASGDLSDVQFDKVSTVSYFGLTLTAPGTFDPSDGGAQGWNSQALTDFVNQAHANGDRAVVTIKSFNNTVTSSIVNNPANGQAAINSAINAMTSRGLDGVNLDFEGSDGSLQQAFTNWVANLSSQLRSGHPGAFLSVDSYSGSASWNNGFIRVDTLAPYVDAFFIMAYDMTFPSTLPNAPLGGPYTYYDTLSVDQYVAKSGDRNKVILGVPYYGYKFSTTGTGFNSQRSGACNSSGDAGCADNYADIVSEFQCAQSLQVNWDGPSSTPWASWNSPATGDPCGGNHNSWRELYYDNATSLGAKYDLANNRDIRGVGIWALGMDHGLNDLWQVLGSKFLTPSAHANPLATTQASRAFTVSWATDAGSPPATAFNVYSLDGSGAWLSWYSGSAGSATFYGRAGHSYSFKVQGVNGLGNGPIPAAPQATTMVASAAPAVTPYGGIYVLDGWGGVHGAASPPADSSASWPNWDIARSLAVNGAGDGGVVLDGWGGVHGFGSLTATSFETSAYWYGWDIARDVVLFGDGTGGYVLDGWGALHPFRAAGQPMPADASTSAYWRGWDIARRAVLFPDRTGGYVLDGWGGLHGFGAGATAPLDPTTSAYWRGWDIARGVMLVPGTHSGYVLDGWGGLQAFSSGGVTPAAASSAYWSGWDIARGIVASPASTATKPAGWILDGWGGMHPYGSAQAFDDIAYWPGWDIARSIGGN